MLLLLRFYAGSGMSLEEIGRIRINHPEIIAYKARIVSGIENASALLIGRASFCPVIVHGRCV